MSQVRLLETLGISLLETLSSSIELTNLFRLPFRGLDPLHLSPNCVVQYVVTIERGPPIFYKVLYVLFFFSLRTPDRTIVI